MAAVSFWVAPAAVRQAQKLQEQASRSLILAGLEPGRFVELPNSDGVMYVDWMNADGTKFKKMFIDSERANAAKTARPRSTSSPPPTASCITTPTAISAFSP